MRHVYLLRHATPGDGSAGQKDLDRPLDPIGIKEAGAIGQHIRAQSHAPPPQLVLCSNARRTLDTLGQIRPHLDSDVTIHVESNLYCASSGQIVDALLDIDDAETSALVIGHNPGMAECAIQLARSGEPELRERLGRRFPPGTLALLRFDVLEWSEILSAAGELTDFTLPSDLL